jgi:hypothetical protein
MPALRSGAGHNVRERRSGNASLQKSAKSSVTRAGDAPFGLNGTTQFRLDRVSRLPTVSFYADCCPAKTASIASCFTSGYRCRERRRCCPVWWSTMSSMIAGQRPRSPRRR